MGENGLAEFWQEWGSLAYLGAAAWAFFEGETFVLLASAAGRATNLINPWYLMISVWLGSYLGDQTWFFLGRRYGTRVLHRIPSAERRMATALRFLEKYGDGFVLTFRFVYGIRNVASVACGLSGMSRIRFAVLNFIAAGLWAASFVAGGWFLATWLGPEGVGYLLAVIGVTVIGWLVIKFWRGNRKPSVGTTPVL